MALDARKKEDNAIEALTLELDSKRKESKDLHFKVKELQATVEAKDYDVQRAKEGRDQLMSHYEQQIVKINEDLSMEKRETSKLRELLQNTTPIKHSNQNEKSELIMLREEVAKKSELIKNLAARVTTPKGTPKKSKGSSSAEESCCVNHRAEIEKLKTKHEKDIEKQESRY